MKAPVYCDTKLTSVHSFIFFKCNWWPVCYHCLNWSSFLQNDIHVLINKWIRSSCLCLSAGKLRVLVPKIPRLLSQNKLMKIATTSRVKMLFVPLQLSFRKAKSLHYLLLSLSLFLLPGWFSRKRFLKITAKQTSDWKKGRREATAL